MGKWNLEQRCAIKFCVKLNKKATEPYEKLKRVYGEHVISRAQVFGWHEVFSDGRESVEDEPRSGRPCTSKTDENVTKVRALVRSDRRLTEWSVVSWNWITELSTTSWPRNWTCRKYVRNWFQKNSPTNKRKTGEICAWTFLNASKITKIFSNMS